MYGKIQVEGIEFFKVKCRYLFIGKLKVIKSTAKFFYLLIFLFKLLFYSLRSFIQTFV